MAKRNCPLCEGILESYEGCNLRQRAKEHYAIVHLDYNNPVSKEEYKKWVYFYNNLPKGR